MSNLKAFHVLRSHLRKENFFIFPSQLSVKVCASWHVGEVTGLVPSGAQKLLLCAVIGFFDFPAN